MVGMLSDVGNRRKLNEDSLGYYEDNSKRIYIIADGMGGHNAGEVASKLAVDTAIEYIKNIHIIEDSEKVLKEAIQLSNKKIYDLSLTDSALKGMGTTITACFIIGEELLIANVGDSSCYVIKDDDILKITKDHSLVQQLVDNGSITEAEALHHPNRNIITRSLGTHESVEVDIFKLNIKELRSIILCSDGLTNDISKNEMYEIISQEDCQAACEKLIYMCKQRDARDNISVIVIEGECKNDRNNTRK